MNTTVKISSEEDLMVTPKKPKEKIIFLSITTLLIIVSSVILVFSTAEPVAAQVKELYLIYFQIDSAREESAQIFADLLETKSSSLGIVGLIPENPKFSGSPKKSIKKLRENRDRVNEALRTIDTKNFASPVVAKAHAEVRLFYKQMQKFEEGVLLGLERTRTKKDFARLIDKIFESPAKGFSGFEKMISSDKKLLKTLRNLSETYDVAFSAKSYDEIFRKRYIELRTPVISKSRKGVAVYPVVIEYGLPSVPKDTTRSTISANWIKTSITQLQFILVHPSNKVFSISIPEKRDKTSVTEKPLSEIALQVKFPEGSSGLKPYYENMVSGKITGDIILFEEPTKSNVVYGNTWVQFHIFHSDKVMQPIEGEWKLYVIAPEGEQIVFGAIHINAGSE